MTPKENQEFIANIHDWVMIHPPKDFMGTHVGQCLKGFNNKMKTFKLEHGHMSRADIEADHTLDMDCHESTDTVKMLDSMIKGVDKLSKLLNKSNGER